MVSVETCWNACDEVGDVVEVDAALAVADQRDGQLVDPGIAGQGAGGQLGQLAVVAAGQALPHLADVLLHHVVVVEQPLAGRTHVGTPSLIGVGVARGGEPAVGVFQDAPGVVEPGEERGAPDRPLDRQPLTGRHLLGPLGQVLGAQQLAADGAGEAILAGIRADEGHDEGEGAAELRGLYRSDGQEPQGGYWLWAIGYGLWALTCKLSI